MVCNNGEPGKFCDGAHFIVTHPQEKNPVVAVIHQYYFLYCSILFFLYTA
jgi:hypothetical protein